MRGQREKAYTAEELDWLATFDLDTGRSGRLERGLRKLWRRAKAVLTRRS